MIRFTAIAAATTAFLTTLATPSYLQANDYYIAQIIMTASNFCPRGTMTADGKLLPISSNTALFSLLGTQYGGDDRTTFALPDMRPVNESGERVPYKTTRYCVVTEGLYPSRS